MQSWNYNACVPAAPSPSAGLPTGLSHAAPPTVNTCSRPRLGFHTDSFLTLPLLELAILNAFSLAFADHLSG